MLEDMAFLKVRDVHKVYGEAGGKGQAALNGVSFEAERGEWIAVIGKSGCGKSTLLNLCGAMDFPTAGTVTIGGAVTSNLDDRALTRLRRHEVGFVFQNFQLLHTLSVLENVEVPLQLAGADSTRRIAQERLAWVEMDQFQDRVPHQLSGGQQQRVAIARALVHSPKLILADEPTGNLDTATGATVLELLGRVASESGALVLMATHSKESTALTSRVIAMRDGRILEDH